MTEFDLDVLDVWESPNGNYFLKVDTEYSISLGPVDNFGPSDWERTDGKYVKANSITSVKKVGRLVISDKVFTKEEVQPLIDPLLDQMEYYQKKYHLAESFIINYHTIPWYKRLFFGRRYIHNFLIQSLYENRKSNTFIEQIVNQIEKV